MKPITIEDVDVKVEMFEGKYRVVMGDYVISGPYDTEDEALDCIDAIIDSFEDGVCYEN
ncbi:MAG: hypothetical protein L0Y56_00610 [Nitrospira sp.]|nr:hypothetical protein [Nitrospira sp.]